MSDTAEDMESLVDRREGEIEFYIEKRENQWANGLHIDKYGRRYMIKHLSDRYILNIINYFNEYDTKPLQQELNRRKQPSVESPNDKLINNLTTI